MDRLPAAPAPAGDELVEDLREEVKFTGPTVSCYINRLKQLFDGVIKDVYRCEE